MNWTSYQIMPRTDTPLPRCAGVYAIYFDGELVYIGQSNNIANRFSEHKFRHGYARCIRTPWADIDENTVITVKVKRSRRLGDWAMWEIRLIHRLKPFYNRQHRGRKAA